MKKEKYLGERGDQSVDSFAVVQLGIVSLFNSRLIFSLFFIRVEWQTRTRRQGVGGATTIVRGGERYRTTCLPFRLVEKLVESSARQVFSDPLRSTSDPA